ncbi:hypothetical protein Pan153_58320 [Gimesia panareensis]|uniref:YscD cytoplasmic domain-containing protein n=1 Tax=Gimesia panareensis TaxID=2527978 RepID=A0A518FY21_9PLAN|nr:FHA domain-containing protein [Gimesia panareensis]QDV21150.1 hypothetical protein Pan153_58320 [Gimesia panareensis]
MVVESSPQYSLEIVKGKTRFPVRPLQGDRLTIGAGTCCGLQISGHSMPILHTVIHIEAGEVAIEAIAPQPRLLLNGIPHHTSVLSDGDVITIGPIEFVFRQVSSQSAMSISRAGLSGSPSETSAPITPDKRDHSMTNETSLKELSASELVDLIEQDFQMIEQYESRREQGAAALLSRVNQLKDEQEFEQDNLSVEEQSSLMADLETMMEELTKFSAELQQRADQLTSRERQYEAAAASLLETQEKLSSQLDQTLDHVGSLRHDQEEDGGSQRAIA